VIIEKVGMPQKFKSRNAHFNRQAFPFWGQTEKNVRIMKKIGGIFEFGRKNIGSEARPGDIDNFK
jgi:hypothetical protein